MNRTVVILYLIVGAMVTLLLLLRKPNVITQAVTDTVKQHGQCSSWVPWIGVALLILIWPWLAWKFFREFVRKIS